MSKKLLDNTNPSEIKTTNTLNCAYCGKTFRPKSHYFIWFGIAIYVCEEPCTYKDFISSQ